MNIHSKKEIEGFFFLHSSCDQCSQSIIVFKRKVPTHCNGKDTYYLSDVLRDYFNLDPNMSDEAFKKLKITIEVLND